MRSVSKGVISFGLVSIPVKLYSTASSDSSISFKLLGPNGRRLKQQYVDPDGNVVQRAQMLKGYEFAKDKFVIFSQAEIKTFAEATSPNITIEEFVPVDRVPDTFRSKSYYLTPDKGGLRAYGLLSAALSKSNRMGLGRRCTRGKQHLVAIEAYQDGLLLTQLHHVDSVADFENVRVAPDLVPENELKMAQMLIEQASSDDFKPEKYQDDARARLEHAVAQKMNGQPVDIPKPEPPKEHVIDLVAALKASLEKKGAA